MVTTSLEDSLFLFSNRQIIGGCLDYLQTGLKDGLCGMVKNALGRGETMSQYNLTTFDKWDLATLLNYCMTNFNDFLFSDTTLKTLLFELKGIRNNWAHQSEFTLREVYRACDTIQLFLEKLGVDQNTEFFKKINFLREQVVLRMVQDIIDKNKKQTITPLFNLQMPSTTMTIQTQEPVISSFGLPTSKPSGISGEPEITTIKSSPEITFKSDQFFKPIIQEATTIGPPKKKFVNDFPEMIDD